MVTIKKLPTVLLVEKLQVIILLDYLAIGFYPETVSTGPQNYIIFLSNFTVIHPSTFRSSERALSSTISY
jgi:hypothetical protein